MQCGHLQIPGEGVLLYKSDGGYRRPPPPPPPPPILFFRRQVRKDEKEQVVVFVAVCLKSRNTKQIASQ